MIADGAEAETSAWLICDHATIRKYGLGYAKPAPVPVGIFVRNGYLARGTTLRELTGECWASMPTAWKERFASTTRGGSWCRSCVQPRKHGFQSLSRRCRAQAQSKCRLHRRRALLRAENHHGRSRHPRWIDHRRSRPRGAPRRYGRSADCTPSATIAPRSWAATIPAPASRSDRS